jgi:sigma-B regulation protein RsbU (phosphoserine phosphatase)
LAYVNGGHEPVIIVNHGRVRERLKATGPAVGMMPESKYMAMPVQIEPGDILIGYTDGVT